MASSIRPADMPEVRAEMLDWYERHGRHYFTACVSGGAQRLYFPTRDADTAGCWYSDTEASRLASAELFWVSREMTELCVTAARSMPEWSLTPEDLPSPSGLIYFEGLPTLREFPTTAMTWGACPQEAVEGSGLKGPGMWLSHYAAASFLAEIEDLDLGAIRFPMAPLIYDSESLAAFGQREPGDIGFTTQDGADFAEADDYGLASRASSLVVVKAAWLLMSQGLADVSDLEPDRAAKKRIRRTGQEPKSVRVIELRRPKSTGGAPGESGREYHHRWITRGHWRQQWYPAREVHRPVWIAPHLKGPEGAPLLGGDKVYAWKR